MEINIKDGYKISELGVIPDDWEIRELGSISKVVRGGSPRPAGDPKFFGGNYIPWLTVAALTNISESCIYVSQTAGFLTEEGAKYSRTLENGTLIIANSGATLGVAKILSLKCCANDGIAVFLDLNKDAEKLFLYYVLNAKTREFREVVATGNGQPNLNTTLIGLTKIPLPPLSEQKAIAHSLSDVDNLITAIDQLITKKRNIKQGTMQQLLTGKKRLPGFSGEWEVKKLGDILKVKHGKSQHNVIDENGEFPILATGGEIGKANTYLYNKPSVLIGRKGTIDIPQYMDTPFWTIDTLFYTEIFNNAVPKFVFYRFNLINWYSYNEASGVPSLNAKTIENIDINFPNNFLEQKAIAEILSDIDKEIEALEKNRDKYKAIKQGMMQELLTGKTRLKINVEDRENDRK
jgi:type I restriction enzyme S subunit